VTLHSQDLLEAFSSMSDRLVYLTADADEDITTLEGSSGYIVGGIVDRNRYKCLCLEKSKDLGVQSARLPIGKYIKLAGSRV
jgi:tRNA (guanine9-N1)-methyltransferase